jgi:hypothetical protein
MWMKPTTGMAGCCAAPDRCMKNAALLRGVSRIKIEQSFVPQIQRAIGSNDFETLILPPPPSNAVLCI